MYCYGDLLYEGDFPFDKSRFSKLLTTIKNLGICKIPEFDQGATGGETLTLKLHKDASEYYSGYIYGSEYKLFGGTTDANLYLVKSEIEKCIPDFQTYLTKEKEEKQVEYEFEDDEPSFFEKYWKYGLAAVVILLCIYFCSNWNGSSQERPYDEEVDTLTVDTVAADSVVAEVVEVSPTPTRKAEMKEEKKIQEEPRQKQEETIHTTPQTPVQSNNAKQSQNNISSFNAEAKPEPVKTEKVFDVVEEMPSFPGGASGLLAYLNENIKYPVVAEENGIQGRVIVTFVVEKDGSITDVKVVKSVDPSLDKEAVRVIRNMPRWKPGKQSGSAVRVKYTTPVTFRLQ